MHESFKDKIYSPEQSREWSSSKKDLGFSIVFTNGCFDILHLGHIEYLEKAKTLGDFLIVGLNSDDSVRRLKGNSRPIKDQQSRAAILASLQFVDLIVVFEEDTPLDLIQLVEPDVLVKGGDYKVKDIVGGDFTKSIGGEVQLIDFVEGYSSSTLISKMKNNN